MTGIHLGLRLTLIMVPKTRPPDLRTALSSAPFIAAVSSLVNLPDQGRASISPTEPHRKDSKWSQEFLPPIWDRRFSAVAHAGMKLAFGWRRVGAWALLSVFNLSIIALLFEEHSVQEWEQR